MEENTPSFLDETTPSFVDDTTPSFEESLARLEEIVSLLNNGRAPLAEALSLFEEGAGLLRTCTTQLDEAEAKVNLVTPTGENAQPETQPMTQED